MHWVEGLRRSCALAATMLALGTVVNACGRADKHTGSALQTLANHTPGLVDGSQATGHVNPEQMLTLRVALPLRDTVGLQTFLTDLYDPQSTSYQQYLTPETFAATYGPNTATVAQVRSALLQAGFQVDNEAHGFFIGATASAAAAETFFHTQLDTYETVNGNSFFAPSTDVAVDADIAISAVIGLHTSFPATSNLSTANVRMDAAASPLFNASQVRSAYNIPAAATGAGQVVGLFELDGYLAADIALYDSSNGIAQPPRKNILVNGFSGTPQNATAQSEVTLDIELVNAMAPGLQEIRVYESANTQTGWVDLWNEIANPQLDDKELVALISTSWGLVEAGFSSAEVQSEAMLFQQMAAQGQTVSAATGDFGAKPTNNQLAIQDPSAQPYVLAIGGTSLSTPAAYTSEVAWAGSGGGISTLWPIPAWQVSAVNAASGASTTMRNVPDVSLDSDPNTGYLVYVNGVSETYGGTSCASPLWTGFFALVNQARATNGLAPMGFAAPPLYLIASSTAYKADFHDITSGNNNGFNAAPGLDNVTGLGSFNGANLMQTLAAGYARSVFPTPVGLTP